MNFLHCHEIQNEKNVLESGQNVDKKSQAIIKLKSLPKSFINIGTKLRVVV